MKNKASLKANPQDRNFSKLFHVIIDTNIWSELSPKAKAVYVVLLRFAEYSTRITFLSMQRISVISGLHLDSVPDAIKELVIFGLIQKKRTGPRMNFMNSYYLMKEYEIGTSLVLREISKGDHCISREIPGKCNTLRDPITGKFLKKTCKGGEKALEGPGEKHVNSCGENSGKILEIDIRDNKFRSKNLIQTLASEVVKKMDDREHQQNSK